MNHESKKPSFEEISSNIESSIYISHQVEEDIARKDYWHFHSSFELVFLPSGKGKRYVGQRVSEYKNGDLVLLAPNTPHNTMFKEHIGQRLEQYIILFDFSIFHRFFILCKEFNHINKLFDGIGAGMAFRGKTKKKVGKLVKEMESSRSFKKIILFFEIMDIMANSKDYDILGPVDSMDMPKIHKNKIQFINAYVSRNFQTKLSSSDMASKNGMTNSSFCRFYKKSTGKTFKRALNDVRIQHSCFLLKNTNMPVEGIAMESGFNSIPLFYRFFKKTMKTKPSEYRRKGHN